MAGLGRAVKRLRLKAELTRDAVARGSELRGSRLSGKTIAEVEEVLKEEVKWGTMRRLAKGLKVEPQDLVQLSMELAPGRAGERLRQEAREAREIDIDAFIAEVKKVESRRAPRSSRDRPRQRAGRGRDFDVEALIAEVEEEEQRP